MSSFFLEFAAVFVIIFLVSYTLSYFKQPILIGYILGGIFLGPLFFDILSSSGYYQIFSHIGIAFLLFLVGLHLNIKLIKDVGLPSILTGVGQILITMFFSILLTTFLGFEFITSVIIAVGLSFSSTIVIVKLLSDKNALETLYGKISLGFLLVQDFVAVLVLLLINSFIALSGGGETSLVFLKLFLAMLIAVALFFITKPLLKFFFKKNHNSEVLFLFSIAWCLGIASLYDLLGFSLEIGALIAGAALASTNLHYEISARIKPLRDFFIILFFIVLGSEMFSSTIDFSEISSNSEKLSLVASELMSILPLALSLSLLVCIGNPIIVFLIMTALKYTPRIAFNAGLAVSQISEFSLIIALLAFQSGIIDSGVISLLTLVMLLTITISSYMFYHSDELYAFFSPMLKRVNKHKFNHDEKIESGLEVIISGLSRSQEHHMERIWRNFHHVTIVENNQKNYQDMKKRGFPVVFGDMSNVEFISEFDMSSIKLCISLHQDEETSIMLVENIRKINNKGVIIVSAESEAVAYQLYVKGADYVIIPNHVHHEKAFSMIEDLLTSKDRKKKLKDEHIKFLKDVLD